MSNRLTNWHIAVKIEMTLRRMSVEELAKAVGMTRTYLSAILNNRQYSTIAVRKISDFLNIPDGDFEIVVKYKPKRG